MVFFSFFKYFEEFYHNPGSILSRGFTPYAKLQFRNFNELPHAFHRRMNLATEKANMYLSHFPNETLIILTRFIEFICGSFLAVLILFSVFDNELSLEFEITPQKTVLFYIGLLGTIVASCRAMQPSRKAAMKSRKHITNSDEDMMHPAWILRYTLEILQFMPVEWYSQLHTNHVKQEFLEYFQLNIVTFSHEIIGIFVTPFILILSLAKSSDQIVDFFRVFSSYSDKVGYVCSLSTFDFETNGDPLIVGLDNGNKDPKLASNGAKMEQSFIQFKTEYPEWEPENETGSQFLKLAHKAEQHMMFNFAKKNENYQNMENSILPTGKSIISSKKNKIYPKPNFKKGKGHDKSVDGDEEGLGEGFSVDVGNMQLSQLPLVLSTNMENSMNNSMIMSRINGNNTKEAFRLKNIGNPPGGLQNFNQNKVPQRGNATQKKAERNNPPKYSKPDSTDNVEVSVRHLLDGTPQKRLKKLCSNGSDKKVGMSWTQFRDEGRGAFEASKSISKHLPNLYFSMQEDFKVRTTYCIFHSVADAEELMKKYIIFDGKKIELYQTVRYEEKVTVINFPNYRDMNILSIAEMIKTQLGPLVTIKDISALAIEITKVFLPYVIRIFFCKNDADTELPLFLIHDYGKINLFHQGCKAACSFFKQSGNWKSDCKELKLNKTTLKNSKEENSSYIFLNQVPGAGNGHKKHNWSQKNMENDIKGMKIKLIKSPKSVAGVFSIPEKSQSTQANTKGDGKAGEMKKENNLRDDLVLMEPKSCENMTALEFDDYFGDNNSSESSDLDISGSYSDFKRIKKEPGISSDGYISESESQ
ncbi:Autophagy-related protein 9, partial [Smittium mucronatum]